MNDAEILQWHRDPKHKHSIPIYVFNYSFFYSTIKTFDSLKIPEST